jgi:hypothetical protein
MMRAGIGEGEMRAVGREGVVDVVVAVEEEEEEEEDEGEGRATEENAGGRRGEERKV